MYESTKTPNLKVRRNFACEKRPAHESDSTVNRRGGERKLFLSTNMKIFAKRLKIRATWLVETRSNDRAVAVRELKLMARADHEARRAPHARREALSETRFCFFATREPTGKRRVWG